MNILIPMTGFGTRFKNAGYKEYKPFVTVDEKNNRKVLDFVLDSFDKSDNFYFIVRESVLNDLKDFLSNKNLKTKIFTIKDSEFVKNGPVGTIYAVKDEISSIKGDLIVSYCDFGVKWDYKKFLNTVSELKETNENFGVVPCYSGNHPNLKNPKNVYAAYKVNSNNEIQAVFEKYNSKNRLEELWSPGIYYFSSVDLLLESSEKLLNSKVSDECLNGEFYCSLLYRYIDGFAFNFVDKFYQLGTPEDLEHVKKCLSFSLNNNCTSKNRIILAAGKGERFLKLNYKVPKPFLPVDNKPLYSIIKNSINANQIVCSKEHRRFWETTPDTDLLNYVPSNKIGASFSYYSSLKNLKGETLIVPCDLLCNYPDIEEYKSDYDAIIFVTKPTDYQIHNLNSFSWCSDSELSIKHRKSMDQNVLIGSFWVKDNQKLIEAIEKQFEKDDRVNGEFYLDSAFKYLKYKTILVNEYLSFGTPDEYLDSLDYFYF